MKETSLLTDKGRIIYWQSDVWNEGADTIFFLHGLTADHSMFDSQTHFFEKEFNVLAWDAPGHGKSRPFEAFDFSDTSGYMKDILDTHPSKGVILAGQSLGGYFAQSFIKRYPDRVKGFVSIDSTPYGSVYYSETDIRIIRQIERLARLYPLRLMKTAMAKQVSAARETYDAITRMLEPYGKEELCHLMGMCYSAFLKDNCDLKIPCPVLLLMGEKDRTGKVARYNKAWAKRTGYTLKIIKGAAHNANMDKPLEANGLIRGFIGEISAAKDFE